MTLDDWRARVGSPAADGVPTTSVDGDLRVPWLYVAQDASAVPATDGRFIRRGGAGAPWQIRQEQAAPSRDAARRSILADLEGGATAIALRFDRAAREGLGPGDVRFADAVGRDGVIVHSLDDLDEVLDGVFVDGAPIALSAGVSGIPAAALLVALWQRRGHDLTTIAGSLGIDPLGSLAGSGRLDDEPESAVARAAALAVEAHAMLGPDVTFLTCDTQAYVDAGASAVHEIAIAAATGTAYLRACDEAGLAPVDAAARLEVVLQTDADQFLSIARLRAARRVWARILELCGAGDDRSLRLGARTSQRMLSTLDPWVNMLRTTTAAFAAAVAGADAITVTPFDAPRGATSELGRRIARNTHHVLMDESHLAHVGDPGAGSWYLERLTEDLAQAAWAELQRIEDAGGIVPALTSGWLAARIAETAARREDDVAHRRRILTGVNAFPLLGDDAVPDPDSATDPGLSRREAERVAALAGSGPAPDASFADLVAAAHSGVPLHRMRGARTFSVPPLPTLRDGAAFEALRARAAGMDPAPTVALACVGPIARHNAVVTWARSLFEAGGIRAVSGEPILAPATVAERLPDGSHPLAAVCAAADEDPDLLRATVAALRARGVRRIHLMRASDDTAALIGADCGADEGMDVVTVLRTALDVTEGDA